MRFKLVTLLSAAVLALAACGTAEDDNGQGAQPETEGAGGGGTELTVVAQDFSFEAEGTLPDAGGQVSVSLSNEGEAPHTFSSEEVGLDIEAAAGEQADGSFTVPDDGTVDFQCNIHPQMTLTLTAGEAAMSDAGSGGSKSDSKSDGDSGGGGGNNDYDY